MERNHMKQLNNSLNLPKSHSSPSVSRVVWTSLQLPWVALSAISITFLVFSFTVLIQNRLLIVAVLNESTATIREKIVFVSSLYGSILTNFSIFSAVTTITIAILFGINFALLGLYISTVRSVKGSISAGSSSLGGLISGLLGIGCAACGTFILSTALASFGAGGLLMILPFRGEELGLIGIGLLTYSIIIIAKKLQNPYICPV